MVKGIITLATSLVLLSCSNVDSSKNVSSSSSGKDFSISDASMSVYSTLNENEQILADSLQIETTYYLLITLEYNGSFTDEVEPRFVYDSESMIIEVPEFYNYYFYSNRSQLFLIKPLRASASLGFSYSYSGFYKSFKVSAVDQRLSDIDVLPVGDYSSISKLNQPKIIKSYDELEVFSNDYPEIYSTISFPETIDFENCSILVSAALFAASTDYDFSYQFIYIEGEKICVAYSGRLNNEAYTPVIDASSFIEVSINAFLIANTYSNLTPSYRIFYSI